jgi:hypothetical protein
MKKGCFFSAIIFLTVAIGIGFYLFKKYYPEIKSYGKEKILELSSNELNEKIDKLQKNGYEDSLRAFIKRETGKLKKENFEESMNNFGDIMKRIKVLMKDDIIDSADFNELKIMVKAHERPTKN